jgi:hypothetical protein
VFQFGGGVRRYRRARRAGNSGGPAIGAADAPGRST